MITLLAETPRDREMIEKFQRAYENLRKVVDRQNKKIEELEKELDEYRKRHPATVGVKNGKTYDIKAEKEELSPASTSDDTSRAVTEKKKPGAQPGHGGHFRKRSPITARNVVRASDHLCPECSLPLKRKGTRKRVIEDIPQIVPVITQYRIERMYCSHCRKVYEPDIPEAFPNARLSIRSMLTVAYLKTGMRMSIESVSSTMRELFGIRISHGEIQEMLYQLSDSLGQEYKRLLETIRKAPSRHMDTTSWRENGENMDMWVFVTKAEAIFHIANNNNHEVAENLLKEHVGTDIHDRFSAFETLASKSHNHQQYCWSHIICDAKELEDFYGDEGARIKRSLQDVYEEAKSYHGKGTAEDVDQLHHKLAFLLGTDYDHPKSRKFVDNLLKRKKEWLFRFVVDPEVEPTNN